MTATVDTPTTARTDPAKAEAARVMLADAPTLDNDPVRWWRLITEAEGLRARTGLGLASFWTLVHRGDYAKARAALDALPGSGERGEPPMRPAPPFDCAACGRHMGKTAPHFLTDDERVVCRRCLVHREAHARLYPSCPAGHDMHDHLLSTGTRAGLARRFGVWP